MFSISKEQGFTKIYVCLFHKQPLIKILCGTIVLPIEVSQWEQLFKEDRRYKWWFSSQGRFSREVNFIPPLSLTQAYWSSWSLAQR